MMAVVDSVTGIVYWIPAEYQVAAPMPPLFAPVVMPYRLVYPNMAPVMTPGAAEPQVSPAAVINTTVFVRGVPREATTQSVESHFQSYGDIVSCHVIRHKDASTNKGIAFVKFRHHAAAQRAIDGNSPGVMEQREVFAEWAHPKPATSSPRPLPDHRPIVAALMEYSLPNVPTVTPPHHHLINSPSCYFPATPGRVMPAFTFRSSTLHHPWFASSSGYSPYASYNFPSIHVFGFPHPESFSGARNYNFDHQLSLPRPSSFALPPIVDYNPGSSSITPHFATAASTSDESQSFAAEENTSNLENRNGKERFDDG